MIERIKEMKPIRILHVLAAMDMAGTETLLMTFYRQINTELVQFDFAVCTDRECAYDKEILERGGRIFHYPRYNIFNHFTYRRWWKEFISNHSEYQIIHGHIGSTAAIYLSIAKKYGRYTIAHSHSTNGEKSLTAIIYQLYSYPTRNIADYFFGCSQQALEDRYGKVVANDKKKSRVLNNAIDAKRFIFNPYKRKEIRHEYGLDEKEYIVGTVGRLTPQKNPFFQIKVIKSLVNKGVVFKFLWFGKGELENDIRDEIKNQGIEDYVILAGVRPDVNNILQAMDVFSFPSLWEGLGIACVEAQAAGLPVVCSNAIPHEVKVCKNCHFTPIDDENTWADKIVELMDAPRKDCYQDVVDAGYDIVASAQWLQNFYLSIN